MSHDNDPFAVHEPVTVIDQLRVRPGQRRAVLDLFEQVYKPLAAERGLEWLHTHCAPPFEREGAGGDIHIHWRYPSLGALWGRSEQRRVGQESRSRRPAGRTT